MMVWSLNKSNAVQAKVLAATIIPFCPMVMPLAAVDCQLWGDEPGTHVAVRNPIVGTVQLTSPTSVEPPLMALSPSVL